MVFYSQWTRAQLTALCFILITNLIHLVGLYCLIWETSTSPSLISFHLVNAAEALIAVIFTLEGVCLFVLLYMYMHVQAQVEQSCLLAVGIVCVLSNVLCFTFAGNLSINFAREVFLSTFPAANMTVSSDQSVLVHSKFILALTGTLLKGLCWIFITLLTVAKTFTISSHHQDDTLRIHHRRNIVSNFYVLVRMVVFIGALYYSVASWSMMVLNMSQDFTHSIYTMYLFFPYLISLSISECIEDSRITKGVFLSIIGVFVAFLVKNLLDLAGTIYHCSSHWTRQCIEQNPVYYSAMITNGIAGILLWMCIGGLWPSSDDKKSIDSELERQEV